MLSGGSTLDYSFTHTPNTLISHMSNCVSLLNSHAQSAKGGEYMSTSIYTDGSSRGNPGPGGYGVVMVDNSTGRVVYEEACGFRKTTNNRMEIMSVIHGLSKTPEGEDVFIYSDSKYVTDAFNQGWIRKWVRNGWKTSTGSPVKNPDLWKELSGLVASRNVRFTWVKGHAGNPHNERADFLATRAADNHSVCIDSAFDSGGKFLC